MQCQKLRFAFCAFPCIPQHIFEMFMANFLNLDMPRVQMFLCFSGLFLDGDGKSHNSCSLRGSFLALNSQHLPPLVFPSPSIRPSPLAVGVIALKILLKFICCSAHKCRSRCFLPSNTDQETSGLRPLSQVAVLLALEAPNDRFEDYIIQYIGHL